MKNEKNGEHKKTKTWETNLKKTTCHNRGSPPTSWHWIREQKLARIGYHQTNWVLTLIIWLVVSNILYFPYYMGQSFPLTNIFQRDWNHQQVMINFISQSIPVPLGHPGSWPAKLRGPGKIWKKWAKIGRIPSFFLVGPGPSHWPQRCGGGCFGTSGDEKQILGDDFGMIWAVCFRFWDDFSWFLDDSSFFFKFWRVIRIEWLPFPPKLDPFQRWPNLGV